MRAHWHPRHEKLPRYVSAHLCVHICVYVYYEPYMCVL
jgi:hypothetical protein